MSLGAGDAKLFARVRSLHSPFLCRRIVSVHNCDACDRFQATGLQPHMTQSLHYSVQFVSSCLIAQFLCIIFTMYPAMMFAPSFNLPQTRQGKVAELRLDLNSGGRRDKNNIGKKIALKKIVANMTMSNNDMVALFPDVVGCMNIPSLEIKKMFVHIIIISRNQQLISLQVLSLLSELCPHET